MRGYKVMLDSDLASLYQVETRALNQAIKRNQRRFPEDFMFALTPEEWEVLKSQIVTSDPGDRLGLRYPPYCFTEHGVVMLSSVLNSAAAIAVNIQTIRCSPRSVNCWPTTRPCYWLWRSCAIQLGTTVGTSR